MNLNKPTKEKTLYNTKMGKPPPFYNHGGTNPVRQMKKIQFHSAVKKTSGRKKPIPRIKKSKKKKQYDYDPEASSSSDIDIFGSDPDIDDESSQKSASEFDVGSEESLQSKSDIDWKSTFTTDDFGADQGYRRVRKSPRKARQKKPKRLPRSISEQLYPSDFGSYSSHDLDIEEPEPPKPTKKTKSKTKRAEEAKSEVTVKEEPTEEEPQKEEETSDVEEIELAPKAPKLSLVGIVPLLMSRHKETIEEPEKTESPIGPAKRKKKPIIPPLLSCQYELPGPGSYKVFSTFGNIEHDPTLKNTPSFSFGYKRPIPKKPKTPGPNQYSVGDTTKKGKPTALKYSFGWRRPQREEKSPLGPGSYNDQTLYESRRSPCAIMFGKPKDPKRFVTPGTSSKLTYLGANKPTALLIGKPKPPKKYDYPPPNAYNPVDLNVYKTRIPSFEMGIRRPLRSKYSDINPPIGSYNPNYDYFKKKGNILIGKKPHPCLMVPMDLPEEDETKE